MPEPVALDLRCVHCHGAVEVQFTEWVDDPDQQVGQDLDVPLLRPGESRRIPWTARMGDHERRGHRKRPTASLMIGGSRWGRHLV